MSRVLFVDDEPRILDGLRRALRTVPWDSAFATNADDAIRALEGEPAGVVVTDFRMPRTNGRQLLEIVRDRWPSTARLVLSGHADARDLASVVDTAHQLLQKPCPPSDIVEAVQRALLALDDGGAERVDPPLASIDRLPTPRSTRRALASLLDDGCDDLESATDIIEHDVALAASCVRAMSFAGLDAGQVSLVDAVRALGPALLQSAVEAEPGVRIDDHELRHLNRHSRRVADIARQLAPEERRYEAFCAGLLHGVGGLVAAASRIGCGDARRRAHTGASLLRLWGAPAPIVTAIDDHLGPVGDPSVDDVARAVRMAHAIVTGDAAGTAAESRPCSGDIVDECPGGSSAMRELVR